VATAITYCTFCGGYVLKINDICPLCNNTPRSRTEKVEKHEAPKEEEAEQNDDSTDAL